MRSEDEVIEEKRRCVERECRECACEGRGAYERGMAVGGLYMFCVCGANCVRRRRRVFPEVSHLRRVIASRSLRPS